MTSPDQFVQVGLIEPGPLREDFRRFLALARDLGPEVTLREEPFVIVLERDGAPLLRARLAARQVQMLLGAQGNAVVECRHHEDFVGVLSWLLEGERRRMGAALADSGTAWA